MVDLFYKLFKYITRSKSKKFKQKLYRYYLIPVNVYVKIVFSVKNLLSRKKGTTGTSDGLIISLTSFPARINTVYLVIETLFKQKTKADKIILWLSNEQFRGMEDIPNTLKRQMKRGLEIRFVDDDLKGHKKYFYTFQEYPNSCIILADDDIIYASYMIDRLLETHAKYGDCICCNRGHEITLENGRVASYEKWIKEAEHLKTPTHWLCPTHGAGTLFPPRAYDAEVFNLEKLKECAYYSDDLWLKAMEYMADRKAVYTDGYPQWHFIIRGSQSETLARVNVGQNQNDIAIRRIVDTYNMEVTNLHYDNKEGHPF